jgi:hypothetical protein
MQHESRGTYGRLASLLPAVKMNSENLAVSFPSVSFRDEL